jgi:energy-coupling factor transporter ATP-binding protein EcfA2
MRLREIRLRNFRCYQNEFSVRFEDFTTIVGRNDAGKSTLLEALDIFLNDSVPDKHDGSKHGDPTDIEITCTFGDLPESLVLDQDARTSLGKEYLIDAQGQLVIQKLFNGSLEKPKLSAVRIHALHPGAPGANDLLSLSNTQLKARARELGVDLTTVDQTSNVSLREGIREAVGELAIAPTVLVLAEGNTAKVWKGVQAALPAFALFKADRASSDQDPEAQDPLMAAVKEAVRQREAELEQIVAHVEREVSNVALLTLQKLREMDPTLADTLTPHITVPKWYSQFKATISADDGVPINKRGSGVRRLILLSFFRARASQVQAAGERSTVLYAIEEPETSQHPRNQRMLLSALIDLSLQHQVIITTHTPMLARGVPDNTIRFITNDGQGRVVRSGGSDVTNREICESLGVLPDHSIRMFIAVEGPTDIIFLKNLAKALLADNLAVPDLEELELNGLIMFVPLGGSTVGLWSHRLQGFGRPEFHLCDRDNEPPLLPKYNDHLTRVNARHGCVAVATTRREIENYVHHEAINEALAELGIPLTFASSLTA